MASFVCCKKAKETKDDWSIIDICLRIGFASIRVVVVASCYLVFRSSVRSRESDLQHCWK